jgi:hypothetical protein
LQQDTKGGGVARGKVVEFDYYRFLGILRRATDSGTRIEKTDARWPVYVRAHAINVVAASAIAGAKFEKPTPVIIDEGHATGGLYFYSKHEEGCVRLVPLAE